MWFNPHYEFEENCYRYPLTSSKVNLLWQSIWNPQHYWYQWLFIKIFRSCHKMVTKVKTTILHIYILLQLGQVFLFMSLRITAALVYYSHTEQPIKTYKIKITGKKNLGNTEGLHGKAYYLTRNAISHSYHKLWESQKQLCSTVPSIMSISFQIKTKSFPALLPYCFCYSLQHFYSLSTSIH